jgi:hypothetical protein
MLRLRETPEDDAGAGQAVRGSSGRVRNKSSKKPEEPGSSRLFNRQGIRELEVTILVPSPSPNAWTFKSWREYHKIKKQWLRRIFEASIQHSQFGDPMEHCHLEVQRFGIRELDHDNLVGGCKPLVDSIVKLRFLADDTPDVIKTSHYQQTRVHKKTEQRTVITLRELDGRTGQ